jgi:apolipoprotein N-acyltransferase
VGLAVALVLGGALSPDGGGPVGAVPVAAVLGGGARGVGGPRVIPSTVIRPELAASGGIGLAGHHPHLVVWPEDVVALDRPLAGSPEAAALSALARRLRATLAVGVTVDQGASFLNEVVVWGPRGQLVGSYEKVHRVPFGEYVPDRGLFSHLADLSGVPADAVAGTGTGLVRTPAGPLGFMISFELFYADRARSAVRAGAELLVVPTNTASYASTQVPDSELAADRVQAVAEGRDLVQAATTGYSLVIDNHGTVRRQSVLGARQAVTATVALRRGATPYQVTGDLVVLLASAAALAGGWAAEVAGRRRRGRRAPAPAPAGSPGDGPDGPDGPDGEAAGQPEPVTSRPAPGEPGGLAATR